MQRIRCFAVCDAATLACFSLCWVQRSVWGGWFMRTPAGPCLPHGFIFCTQAFLSISSSQEVEAINWTQIQDHVL